MLTNNKPESKDSPWIAKTDSPEKKKFCAHHSVKKVMLTVFWDIKEGITIDFFEKAPAVNIASYCQLLMQNSNLYFE